MLMGKGYTLPMILHHHQHHQHLSKQLGSSQAGSIIGTQGTGRKDCARSLKLCAHKLVHRWLCDLPVTAMWEYHLCLRCSWLQ